MTWLILLPPTLIRKLDVDYEQELSSQLKHELGIVRNIINLNPWLKSCNKYHLDSYHVSPGLTSMIKTFLVNFLTTYTQRL